MRKILWGFATCGVVMLVGVVATANHAARYPHSFVGRVLHGASHAAIRLNPTVGFGVVLAKLHCEDKPDEVQGVPDDPAPTEEQSSAAPVRTETVREESAPIIIPEDEPRSVVTSSTDLPNPSPEDKGVTVSSVIEWPAAPVCQTAPSVMSKCQDEEQCEVLPKPSVETEGAELLPMPKVEADDEPLDVFELLFGCTKSAVEVSDESYPTTCDKSQADECREDPHRHHHHSGCPYTGRTYPMPSGGCPGGKPACDPKRNGMEEESEVRSEPSVTPPVIRKVRRFKTRDAVEDACPMHPGVDTMEYRWSDRQLYDYGPGPL